MIEGEEIFVKEKEEERMVKEEEEKVEERMAKRLIKELKNIGHRRVKGGGRVLVKM